MSVRHILASWGTESGRYRCVPDTTDIDLTRELRAHEVLDSLAFNIAWLDTERRVIGMNQGFRSIVNPRWRCQEVITRLLSEACPSGEASAWRDAEALLAEAIATGEPNSGIVSLLADDELLEFRVTCSPLSEDGRIVGGVLISLDITEGRRASRATASTSRLASIGQLAAGVAHEINTPVQFVANNNDFLRTSADDLLEAVRRLSTIARTVDAAQVEQILDDADMAFLVDEIPQALEQSKSGLERVQDIVKAMKTFSHPGTEASYVDLESALRSTIDVSSGEWKQVADAVLDVDPALPAVWAKEGELKQVFLNLVVNAAQAIGEREGGGHGVIDVSATCESADAVRITVSDDGSGMPEEVRERVFEQFFTTKPVGKGTGQGLSIVHDIVSAHGGTITIESTVGVGTSFVVVLPIGAPAAVSPSDSEGGSHG